MSPAASAMPMWIPLVIIVPLSILLVLKLKRSNPSGFHRFQPYNSILLGFLFLYLGWNSDYNPMVQRLVGAALVVYGAATAIKQSRTAKKEKPDTEIV